MIIHYEKYFNDSTKIDALAVKQASGVFIYRYVTPNVLVSEHVFCSCFEDNDA